MTYVYMCTRDGQLPNFGLIIVIYFPNTITNNNREKQSS